MTRAEFKRAYSPKAPAKVERVFGVIAWREDGRYAKEDAQSYGYSSEKVAQRVADKLNEREGFARQLVVRSWTL